jgi:arginase family enzyme
MSDNMIQGRPDASPVATQQVADCGDIAVNPFNIIEAIDTVDAAVTELRKDGASVLTPDIAADIAVDAPTFS